MIQELDYSDDWKTTIVYLEDGRIARVSTENLLGTDVSTDGLAEVLHDAETTEDILDGRAIAPEVEYKPAHEAVDDLDDRTLLEAAYAYLGGCTYKVAGLNKWGREKSREVIASSAIEAATVCADFDNITSIELIKVAYQIRTIEQVEVAA